VHFYETGKLSKKKGMGKKKIKTFAKNIWWTKGIDFLEIYVDCRIAGGDFSVRVCR
jgi:hypothetical protein